MKTRNGFVSNSSSSSFVVSMKNKTLSDLTTPIDLTKMFRIRKVITTVDELNEEMIDNYGFGTIEEFKKYRDEDGDEDIGAEYEVSVRALLEGRSLLIGSVPYESAGVLNYFTGDFKLEYMGE